MTLAAPSDYLRIWQLPLIALFVLVWLVAGPYLTRRALLKAGTLSRQQTRLGNAARISLLAQAAALIAAGVVTGCMLLVGNRLGLPALYVLGGVAFAPVLLLMSWLAHWAMLDLPAGRLLRIVLATTGPLLLTAIVIGVAGFVLAYRFRQIDRVRDECQGRCHVLYDVLRTYSSHNPSRPPTDLDVLVAKGYLREDLLSCPANARDRVGYLYGPIPGMRVFGGAESRPTEFKTKVWVCDKRGNHPNLRVVLFADGHVEPYKEDAFQALMQLPENEAIAALVAAEK